MPTSKNRERGKLHFELVITLRQLTVISMQAAFQIAEVATQQVPECVPLLAVSQAGIAFDIARVGASRDPVSRNNTERPRQIEGAL